MSTAWLAIGIGCRAGCPAAVIMALIGRARVAVAEPLPARLFTLAAKADEPGLRAAAASLHLPLIGLPAAALAAVAGRTATPSPASAARFGLPSIAEAAALAGAGADAVLWLPRLVADGATCAIAGPPERRS